MSTLPRLILLTTVTALSVAACSSDPTECENTLVLESADHGTTHVIDDGCTSLTVRLAHEPAVTWEAVPDVDPTVLRFDYRTETADTTDYYFTPLRSGETMVAIDAQPATDAWSATVRVALPD